MEKWKLFNTEKHGQILVSRVENDSGIPKIEFSVEVDGFDVVTIGPTFNGENGENVRDQVFNEIDENIAITAIDDLKIEMESKGLI